MVTEGAYQQSRFTHDLERRCEEIALCSVFRVAPRRDGRLLEATNVDHANRSAVVAESAH